MSATARGATRVQGDWYDTPGFAVRAILPHLPLGFGVLEPAAGRGAIVRELVNAGVDAKRIRCIEIDDARANECNKLAETYWRDALTSEWPTEDIGLVLTNPTFEYAFEYSHKCAEWARKTRGTAALLMRLGMAASEERREFWKSNPADLYILDRRPSFAKLVHCLNKDCGWSEWIAPTERKPKACPKCGGKTKACSTDATDYAWFVWGPGRTGRWNVLECERPERKKKQPKQPRKQKKHEVTQEPATAEGAGTPGREAPSEAR